MTALRVPRHDRPLISVIVLAWNAWEWTERCLEAVISTARLPWELVVVDNASSDGTAAGLAAIEGAVVLRNRANLGFGVAADQGVLRSRAPYVLLLNNDALVEPGWDEALAAVLDAEPDVAAVAARLLHPDGRLQEAGCVLWGDGRADNYGDFDTPDRPEYRFRRDVDYASAACMLVRRSAFLDAGGFDAAFHPAYFEDVDLCLRWRSQGLRVVYQPRATAVHERHVSSDQSAARVLIARNLPVFLGRWGEALRDRPARPVLDDPGCLLAMRDAGCPERFLVVTERIRAAGPAFDAITELGTAWPSSRVTVLATGVTSPREGRGKLEDAGVEVVAGVQSPQEWVRGRAHHHTAVIVDGEVSDTLEAAIADALPGAPSLHLDSVPDGVRAALVRLGMEAELPSPAADEAPDAGAQPAVAGGGRPARRRPDRGRGTDTVGRRSR